MFTDRIDAGRRLADALEPLAGEDVVVLGLPRGGVPVAFEVAKQLHAPLDVFCVRKLGVPGHEELGLGAIAEGAVFVDREMCRALGVSPEDLHALMAKKSEELADRQRRFRLGRPAIPLEGRTVILVDDGIATGGTVKAAVRGIRERLPKRIVLAVPVAAASSLREIASEVDEVVCLRAPEDLRAVGLWYDDFRSVEDEDVIALLAKASEDREAATT